MQPTGPNLEIQYNLFGTKDPIPNEITLLIFKILMESTPFTKFTTLALVSRDWKRFFDSDGLWKLIFDRHLLAYKHWPSLAAGEVKKWFWNLHGSNCNFNTSTHSSQAASKIEWTFAKTDGQKWIVWPTQTGQTLKKINIEKLDEPKIVANFEEPKSIKAFEVSGDTIAVLLAAGRLVVYNASEDTAIINEYQVGVNVARLSLMENKGLLYQTFDGLIFYQSPDKSPSSQLTEIVQSFVPQIRWNENAIPLNASPGGYFLAIADEINEKEGGNCWQLRHISQETPIITFPFTTSSQWKINLGYGRVAAFHSQTGQLYVYTLALTANKIQSWEEVVLNENETVGHFQNLEKSIIIWGKYVVITQNNGKVTIIEFKQGQKPSVVFERIIIQGIEVLKGGPFISPRGLNFTVRPVNLNIPGDDFKEALIYSLSFSSFSPALPAATYVSAPSVGHLTEPFEGKKRKREGSDY